jgi:tetratricopeptide (TPR) repeat protein
LEEYEHALQDYDKAIQINPQLADAYLARGRIYIQLGKVTEAEADFKKYEELTGQKP